MPIGIHRTLRYIIVGRQLASTAINWLISPDDIGNIETIKTNVQGSKLDRLKKFIATVAHHIMYLNPHITVRRIETLECGWME